MQGIQQLNQLWNRLPAFRVVAETEHLPEAAELLNVTPSALSRSIRLLEDSLGCDLFERSARRMILNDRGKVLLRQLRIAMRHLHDGVASLDGDYGSELLSLSAFGGIAWFFLGETMTRLNTTYPELLMESRSCPPKDCVSSLLRGSLDLAVVPGAAPKPGVDVQHLGSLSCGIYCGSGHPLAHRTDLALEHVLAYPFVAPVPQDADAVDDGWPKQIERRVNYYVVDPTLLLDHIQRDKECLIMLPDAFVNGSAGDTTKLLRLNVPLEGAAVSLSAVYRKPLSTLRSGTHRLVTEACSLLSKQLKEQTQPRGASPQPDFGLKLA